MSTKKAVQVILQERDRALLRFLGEHETATFAQIREKFWPTSVTEQTAHDRLDKLRRAGYLTRHTCQLSIAGKTSRYSITKKAKNAFAAEIAPDLYCGKMIDREVIQAIKAVAARLELERRGYAVIGWVSERHLQRTQRHHINQARAQGDPTHVPPIADGQVKILQSTGAVETIDVEIDGAYWGRMLEKKLAGFGAKPIIWATTPNRVARIMREAPTTMKVISVS